jgi:hypothetical protein
MRHDAHRYVRPGYEHYLRPVHPHEQAQTHERKDRSLALNDRREQARLNQEFKTALLRAKADLAAFRFEVRPSL